MNKNGFTLIELLAVIVILAIIALIATPIILGIINDARKESNERSVELYASAVRNAIVAYQLTNANAPTTFEDLDVQYDGNVECAVEELYEDGNFYITECRVNGTEVDYAYGEQQVASIGIGKMSICNPLVVQTDGVYTPGDKYECDVDPGKSGYDQMFYVLNSDGTSVNLIMDSNINISGDAVKEGVADLGLVAWITQSDYIREDIGGTELEYGNYGNNNKGPITAIEYLQAATSSWTNTNKLTINTFTDNSGNTHNMKEYIVNARLPYYSEISDVNNSNLYLYNYLDNGENQTNVVSGVSGYWMLSSSSNVSYGAWFVFYHGFADDSSITGNELFQVKGIRPVINLSI